MERERAEGEEEHLGIQIDLPKVPFSSIYKGRVVAIYVMKVGNF